MRQQLSLAPLLGAGILALPAPSALAQRSDRPSACAPMDSARTDSVRAVSPNHGPLALALATFVAAPSALLLLPDIKCLTDTLRLAFWRPRVISAYVVAGAALGDPEADESAGGALSADIEALWRGVYAVGRLERFYLPGRLQSHTIRVGYLIHPTPTLAGGMTIGYRGGDGRKLPRGVEIGFPLMGVLCRDKGTCWMRWEPAYVISSRRVRWSPRYRAEFPIGRSALVAGVDLEANGVRKEDLFRVAVLIGARNAR